MHDVDPHAITDRASLRALTGEPGPRPANKVIDRIDPICGRFIAASPFCVMATRGADGLLDLSPKGDPAGFVAVLDERTLVIPDRPGNRRHDSFENLLVDPSVALIFLIPGHGDMLRVAGRGRITTDPDLLARFPVDGRLPRLAVVIHVEEAFLHCPKAVTRSRLWEPEGWPDRSDVPSLAEGIMAHARLREQGATESVAELQAVIDRQCEATLY
jgi:uncharacterized protein